MQPVCLRPLFKRHIHLAAQLLEKAAYSLGPSLNRRFHHYFAGSIQRRDPYGCAMHVHTNIISFHRALLRSVLEVFRTTPSYYLWGALSYSVATGSIWGGTQGSFSPKPMRRVSHYLER